MSPLYEPDLSPSSSDDGMGWTGTVDSFGRPEGELAILRESDAVLETEAYFDDTFQLALARLREANDGKFERGIPTNDKTSSRNYDQHLVKIIDGEHKTLLSLGKISEAMEEDDHRGHILEHRLLLASPDLRETQRAAMLEHIATHVKSYKRKLKAAKEVAEAHKQGLGTVSKAKRPITDDVIPQDDPQSAERKRTAGMISQEAGLERKLKHFETAVRSSYGRRY